MARPLCSRTCSHAARLTNVVYLLHVSLSPFLALGSVSQPFTVAVVLEELLHVRADNAAAKAAPASHEVPPCVVTDVGGAAYKLERTARG